MAISVVAVSNAAGQSNGTTTTASTVSVAPTLPAGTAWGDRVFVIQVHNNASGSPTPSNWTALCKDVAAANSLGAPGAGSGKRFISVYYRNKDDNWSACPSFSVTSGTQNTQWVAAVTLRKTGITYDWDTPYATTIGDDTVNNTSHSATTGGFTTGANALLIAASVNNDNVTMTSAAISQTGATFGTVTERADGGSATGNDVSGVVHTIPVTTGAAGSITFTGTLSISSQGGTLLAQQTETYVAPGPAISTLVDQCDAFPDTGVWAVAGDVTNSPGNGYIFSTASDTLQSVDKYDMTSGELYFTHAGSGSLYGGLFTESYYRSFIFTDTQAQPLSGFTAVGTARTFSALDQYKIRESAGTWYWEYSTDSGANWTSWHSEAVSAYERKDRVQVIFAGNGSTTQAYVDDINYTPPPPGPIADLVETFESASFPNGWTFGFAPGSLEDATFDNDRLTLSYGSTSPTGGAYTYNEGGGNGYELAGGALWWENPVPFVTDGVDSYWSAGFGGATEYYFQIGADGHLYCTESSNSTSSDIGVFDTTADRWMKIAESGGTIYFYTAPDGLTWTQRWSCSADTTTGSVAFIAIAGASTPAVATCAIDNVNVTPTPSNTGKFFAFF
jgi:hypothetical protein